MKKPSVRFISWSAFAGSLVLALAYRFFPVTAKYFEAIGVELVILIPVAIIIMYLLEKQRRDDRSFKQGGNPNDRSNQGGGNNPHYNQSRQN